MEGILSQNVASRKRSRRSIAMAVALAALTMAGAACGSDQEPGRTVASLAPQAGSASAAAPQGGSKADPVAFAQCVRENGVPDFKDPEPGKGLDLDSPALTKAAEACKEFMPAPPPQNDPGATWSTADKLKYAACMRDNGVPSFPDPDAGGGFKLDDDPNTPQFKKAEKACEQYQPQSIRNMTPGKTGGGS
ncbi:hypothetical protein GCM10022419_136370 [Nonomuraea rosea]|uniref:Septum formation-related domain-containing protein n=1 Tax=Nonomuraea rosea TaxID=638574 RepID=A0ABP7AAI2_9ACTN